MEEKKKGFDRVVKEMNREIRSHFEQSMVCDERTPWILSFSGCSNRDRF